MSLRPQTVDFDVMWDQIRNTAHKVIQLGHVPKCEWNDRFHDVYKLCVAFPGLYTLLVVNYLFIYIFYFMFIQNR